KLVVRLVRGGGVAALALTLTLVVRPHEIGERHGADLRARRRLGLLDVVGHRPRDGRAHLDLPRSRRRWVLCERRPPGGSCTGPRTGVTSGQQLTGCGAFRHWGGMSAWPP